MDGYFGEIGLILILAGWLTELWGAIRKGKPQVPLGFAVLYACGSFLLALYSMELNDAVFLALNAFATMIALANVAFNLVQKGRKGTGGKRPAARNRAARKPGRGYKPF
jgi:lipid-A-disaccharide synthase-like uncharacterized protein